MADVAASVVLSAAACISPPGAFLPSLSADSEKSLEKLATPSSNIFASAAWVSETSSYTLLA